MGYRCGRPLPEPSRLGFYRRGTVDFYQVIRLLTVPEHQRFKYNVVCEAWRLPV